MIKVGISKTREMNLVNYRMDENTVLQSCGAITVNKTDFFPSGFLIQTGEKNIYIDPVRTAPGPVADYILITHSHPDHYSKGDLEKLSVPGKTIIIGPEKVVRKLSGNAAEKRIMQPGERAELAGLTVEAVPSYNRRPVFLWIKAHSRKNNHLGYIITLPGNMRIYHAGDTDYIAEMADIRDIDVALIPVGGDKLTMDIGEAVSLMNILMPRVMIPMHFEISMKNELRKLTHLVDPAVKVVLPPMDEF
jgi:L-ascorbate metabolism protein UlaG (beta-lactamase superfamily)